ncbi:hypothetical protein BC941DRAFT_470217 [Chlamydoabsidia padenii]|nr:hypothetical protein BC941DRAFT_470217 [Chlamydoabsidia padenii]
MTDTLQDITSTQEPFFCKLKSGFSKLISWRRHSLVADTIHQQESYISDSSDDDESDTSGLQQSIYVKDDDFERRRYNKARRASAIETPPLTKPTHRHTKSLQTTPHTSHISFLSNSTVNSEDLTSKEFATMAGIKIHSEQNIMHHPSFSCSSSAGDDWSVLSSRSTTPSQIWDTGFWKRPDQHYLLPSPPPVRKHRSQHRQTLSLPPPIPTTTTIRHHAKSKSTCDLPIVHELRHHPVLRKGRFEVQLESSPS